MGRAVVSRAAGADVATEQPPLFPVSAGGTHLPVGSQMVGATQSLTEAQVGGRHAPLLSHL